MILPLALLGCVQKPPPVLRPQPPREAAPVGPVDARGVWLGRVQTPSGPVDLRVEVVDEAAPVLVVQGQRLAGRGERHGNQVRWTVPALGVVLAGTVEAERFRGSFEQLGRAVPVVLERMHRR